MPDKRSINFVTAGIKPTNWGRTAAVIVVGTALVLVAAKYAVLDRFQQVYEARTEVAEIQEQLTEAYRKLDQYKDISELYAHYTFSGMTAAELALADRVDVIEMIETVIMPSAQVSSWNLAGNIVSVNISSSTLQQINLITQRLEENEMVSYCNVTAAAGNIVGSRTAEEIVTAQMMIYLRDASV